MKAKIEERKKGFRMKVGGIAFVVNDDADNDNDDDDDDGGGDNIQFV
ncbi:hypothetical protein DFA_10206 [Cavenderia fasciculata]|uniref:Uncharacterized protein n=1 Tax=Cavenderia fasciculata TaxID=261658 RepID=F4Q9K3_CACFS|nr:uncharacterized protein DFA_10206 [Cavenderia fasciculata]EGG15372.1 hypothetical protein DFA_10206 [Cavenderia fasciculata]|eukprot:XP_004354114.1 hypothetical protein DFA_10206 [Cavenderia fasciculata]